MTSSDTFGGNNWQGNDYSMDSARQFEPQTAAELKKGSFQLTNNKLIISSEMGPRAYNDSADQPTNIEIETS